MAEFITKGCVVSGDYLRLHGNDEIFGHKDFVNDVTVRGDLTVSGDMRVSKIVDFTTESGDISGSVFRGDVAYFDEIVVGNIVGSDSGGSSGESSGGIDTGPIFVTNVNAVGGVREIIESSYSGAVIKKIKTASDAVDVTILAERGDAQTYKPSVSYASVGGSVVNGQEIIVISESHAFYNLTGVVTFAGDTWLTVDYDQPPDGVADQGGALRRDDEGVTWNRVQGSYNFQTIPDNNLLINSNGYSFNSTVRLDASDPVTYIFKNGGRQTSLIIEKDTPPQIISAEFINISGTSSFYGTSSFNSESGSISVQQTEARSGDAARVKIVSNKAMGRIYASGSAISSKNINSPSYIDNLDGTFTFEFNVSISAGNSPQQRSFNVEVEDLIGNPSESYSSDNTILTNNASPSGSVSFSYPHAYNFINNTTDLVSFNVNANNYDNYNFSFSGIFQLKTEPVSLSSGPFILSAENTNSRTSGNFSVSLFKASNGRTASFNSSSVQVQSFGTVPSLNFSPNLFRSSSAGSVNNVNVTVSEELNSLSISGTSDPDINISSVNKNNNKSFSFTINIDDSTPKGNFSIDFIGEKIIGETFNTTDTGSIRGFDQRTVVCEATDYEPVEIGTVVVNPNKLTVSVQPEGGNSFSVSYDSAITGAKQDGTSNLESAFGIIDGDKVVVDNQVITNAGNILDVFVTIEEAL